MLSPLTHALKEWSVAVNALEAGETILLLRKGGIREVGGRFEVKYQQVLLYPTYEHQKIHLLKPNYAAQVTPVSSGWHPEKVQIGSWAQITDILTVSDQLVIEKLLPYHIWNEQFVSERFNWKARQPLYLLLLRVYKLPQPKIIPYSEKYGGCQSWIDLLDPISLEASVPVLDENNYNRQVEKIRGFI